MNRRIKITKHWVVASLLVASGSTVLFLIYRSDSSGKAVAPSPSKGDVAMHEAASIGSDQDPTEADFMREPIAKDVAKATTRAEEDAEPSDAPQVEDPLSDRTGEFLALFNAPGFLEGKSKVDITRARDQAWKLITEVTNSALKERQANSISMIRIMLEPVDWSEVKKIVRQETGEDCEVSFFPKNPYPDGSVEVEIYWYPRDEYPDMYELVSAWDTSSKAAAAAPVR